ncbi:MAG TPA: N-acetylmuramoyl-L-alanine amidase, partial [Gemmatimonadaceae bacterium]|nr:N-acetylmuramoyl-L-alanine amidase [Gemmatimonadaceae bacterium]
MILHVIAACWQLSAVSSLTVRAGGGETQVPVEETDGGLTIRADLLASALGGSMKKLPTGKYSIAMPGLTLVVADHNPFAKADTTVIPLGREPYVADGHVYIPFSVVTDVVPRFGSGIIYDTALVELRVFGSIPKHLASSGGSGDVLVTDSTDLEDGATPGKPHLVVVDAGHGGPDNGMTGPIGSTHPILEKDITLAVAKKVATALKARGIDVVMTRTRDTLIALSDRGKIANEHHGDLFLSIHVNAANPEWHDPAAARGFETYFLAEAKTEDAKRVAQMENEAVRFETNADGTKNDPLNFILNDMKQNQHLRESSELAAIIQRRLAKIHPGPDRGVKQAGFRVLVTAYMPAVLVEIGFGTNAAEAR